MKKTITILTLLFAVITSIKAKIHVVYGYNETHLLTLLSGESFRTHTKIDSTRGVFVYETIQKPKMIKFKTTEGKIITIPDTSSLLGYNESFCITYSLEQLENSKTFVYVYNDEKVLNKNGVDYYSGVLLPRNKKLTLAYIMQYLGQVQDYLINQHNEEVKVEQQIRIDKYNDSVFLAERLKLDCLKKQARIQKAQSMLGIMNTIISDPDIWINRVPKKTYEDGGVILDATFNYSLPADTTVVKKISEEDSNLKQKRNKKSNKPSNNPGSWPDDGPWQPF